MRTSSFLAPIAVTALALAAAVAVPAAASAATPAPGASAHPRVDLATAQSRATDTATHWIDALTAQISRTTADTHLDDADRAKALAIENDDLDGIRTLQTTIAAATSVSQVRDAVRTAADAYRVREVALPQVRAAATADRVTSVTLPRLEAEQKKLSAALTAHPDKSTPAATAALADLETQISTVQSDVDGLASAALALSPDAVKADPTALSHVHDQLAGVRTAVSTAASDAKTVRAALK